MNRSSRIANKASSAADVSPARSGLLQRNCACKSGGADDAPCKTCAPLWQAKLSIGATSDALEHEADRVADQVLAAPEADGTSVPIRRYTGRAAASVEYAPASVEQVVGNRGRPLDAVLQRDMEGRFGHDFSGVRVHSDANAWRSAREINANAYTVGHHIVFGAGRYAPATHDGQRLIAHELTHVIQQSGGSTAATAHSGNGVVARAPASKAPVIGSKFVPPPGATSALTSVHAEFDGQDFTVSEGASVKLTHSAQSGKPVSVRASDAASCGGTTADSYINNPLYVGIKDFGAIPEGDFTLSLSDFAVFSSVEQLQMIAGGMFTDPFGAPLHGGDWGAGRAALHPKKLNPGPKAGCGDTSRRSGFYLHGGSLPGSSGCIDIDNSGVTAFLGLLGGYKAAVPVKVKYTHPAPAIGPATRGLGRFTYPTKDGQPIKDPSIWDRFKAIGGEDDSPAPKTQKPNPTPPAKQHPKPKPKSRPKKKGKGASLGPLETNEALAAQTWNDEDPFDLSDENEEGSFVSSGHIQTKLAVGASDDPLEHEADRVADAVMAAPGRYHVASSLPTIQRSRVPATGHAEAAPNSVHRVISGPGRPMESALRLDMGQRFSHDFSRVRVHSGAAAEQSARDVNANAYTVGHNIVFGAGRFSPETQEGRRLIAHELTHTIQQSAAVSLNPAVQRGRLSDMGGGLVQRNGGNTTSAGAFDVPTLDQLYNKAVQAARGTGNWQDAAEKLNGFNREDIQSRLAQLSPEEVAYLHLGALGNPRVGPDSQVAQLTQPGAPRASTLPPVAKNQSAASTPKVTPTSSVHPTPPGGIAPAVSLEKSSPDLEAAYRRAGLVGEANAVRRCREEGVCAKVLTEAEAMQMYSSGRSSAGLGAATKEAGAPLVAGAVGAAPALQGGAAAESAVAKTALERAAARWGTSAALEGGEAATATGAVTATEAGTVTGAGAAASGAAGVVTIAVPVAAAVYIVVAIAYLASWAKFQSELKNQGYVILPSPLAVCIGSCHQPVAPTFPSQSPLSQGPTGSSPRPWGGPLSEADRRAIEDWLRPEASRPKPNQQPAPQPMSPPQPQPQPPPKSNKCSDELVEKLNKKMHEWCNKERSCSMQVDNCPSAVAKVAAGIGCVRERTELQQKCFSKGDPGYEDHMRQIAQASAALRRCQEVMSAKCK